MKSDIGLIRPFSPEAPPTYEANNSIPAKALEFSNEFEFENLFITIQKSALNHPNSSLIPQIHFLSKCTYNLECRLDSLQRIGMSWNFHITPKARRRKHSEIAEAYEAYCNISTQIRQLLALKQIYQECEHSDRCRPARLLIYSEYNGTLR
jgi:hypothetical protein